MVEAVVLVIVVAGIALGLWLVLKMQAGLEQKHRQMLTDLHDGLTKQGDRLGGQFNELREAISGKLDARLDQISSRVSERLDEGFKKTNETFASVMARLATIDEAQKKIDALTGSVVSLQELLGDKKTRGTFGEVQLEALVRNTLPTQAFEMQYTLANGARADCVLKLPEPTGLLAVDSKFPLENYNRMFEGKSDDPMRALAQKQFRLDIRRHVDDIAKKYIIPNETSDGAVMFVPAEAVFAEIHAYHQEVVDYAIAKRVWIVSPTTLMAVLNTARAVLKDRETKKQIHIIREALVRLGQDFRRFDERMKKLADHIRQAHQDAEDVQVSSRKISQQFQKIESAELEAPEPAPASAANVVRLAEERKPGG
ncbi:MAG: DNA recombination protein RmuC [Betaproteobacteria bacterium]|nr:DNA recombination protein RmuC [Betaproteobacteria bacterium]